jgi:hypothetical protein
MDSHSRHSESSGHSFNTPPRIPSPPHPTLAGTPSSPSCLVETAASGEVYQSSNRITLQNSDDRSIRVCQDSRRPVQQHGEEYRLMEGELGKCLPPCCDNAAMVLNPSRWHMIVDKDHSLSSSAALKRRIQSIQEDNQQKKVLLPHNRWASMIVAQEEMATASQWSTAVVEPSGYSNSQLQLPWSTRKASGRAEVSPATTTTIIIIPSSSVIDNIPTCPPRFKPTTAETGPARPVRRGSLYENEQEVPYLRH